ncbi:MAG: hypothetical protein E7312_09100 [Clostridiales bacterium]|nr:hypothetical protein [Clostridiales bacterium]
MTVYVYADVMLLVCLLTQLPVLWSIARSYGYRFRILRCTTVAVIECVAVILLVILRCNIALMALIWCGVTPFGVVIAFGRCKFKQILRLSALRMAFDGILSGGSMVVNLFIEEQSKNYTSIGVIIIVTIVFCAVIRMKRSAYAIGIASTECGRLFLRIETNECIFEDWALVDSGNTLCEPISKCPVILLGKDCNATCISAKNKTRYVPCRTATGESVLECVKATAMVGKSIDRLKDIGDVWVGYSEFIDCNALIGVQIIQLIDKEK